METQICFEDVEEGQEITPLQRIATTKMMVQWAGATGDFGPPHYDEYYANKMGYGHPIVHGQLKRAWLVRLMTDWIGDKGRLKKLSCRFKGMDYPRSMENLYDPVEGETWWCRGKVIKKYVTGEEHLVECDIWVENGKGDRTTSGNATVTLPSRSA